MECKGKNININCEIKTKTIIRTHRMCKNCFWKIRKNNMKLFQTNENIPKEISEEILKCN